MAPTLITRTVREARILGRRAGLSRCLHLSLTFPALGIQPFALDISRAKHIHMRAYTRMSPVPPVHAYTAGTSAAGAQARSMHATKCGWCEEARRRLECTTEGRAATTPACTAAVSDASARNAHTHLPVCTHAPAPYQSRHVVQRTTHSAGVCAHLQPSAGTPETARASPRQGRCAHRCPALHLPRNPTAPTRAQLLSAPRSKAHPRATPRKTRAATGTPAARCGCCWCQPAPRRCRCCWCQLAG